MSVPPTGTVTFLFTDIEGSTELVKRLGEGYGELLATHRRLLREAFAAEGGTEMGTEGDALFYWFPRVRQAVRAAVAGQRTLAEHPWPDGAMIRVRMGLHTGESDVVESEFVGMGVHRTARIAAAAHGGQVLLSTSTAGVVGDERLPGISLRDLGEFSLKDIDRPERLHQLVIDGLASEFPPLRTEKAASGATAPPRKRRRTPLVAAVVAALVVAGGIAAAVILSGGSKHGASTGTTSTTTVDSRLTAYVDRVDGLLRASQPTLSSVKTFVGDVEAGRVADGAAVSRAHGFVLQRDDLLAAARKLDTPTRFARAQTRFLGAIRLSLQDDQALEAWAKAYTSHDTAAAGEALSRVDSLGARSSQAKDAFLREYGSARLEAVGRSPSTLPAGF